MFFILLNQTPFIHAFYIYTSIKSPLKPRISNRFPCFNEFKSSGKDMVPSLSFSSLLTKSISPITHHKQEIRSKNTYSRHTLLLLFHSCWAIVLIARR